MKNEITIFKDFLKLKRLRLTKQREAICKMIFATHKHLRADDLLSKVKAINASIGAATVYRTLDLLCQSGLAQKHDFGTGYKRYEHTMNHNHHDHLVCIRCGKIIEFENSLIESLQNEIASTKQFKPLNHRLEIFGICKLCQ